MKSRLLESIRTYLNLSIWFFCGLLLIRLLEIYLIQTENSISLNIQGLSNDILYFGKLSLVLLPLYIIGTLASTKISTIILKIIFSLLLITSIGFVIYYSIADMALDNALFAYSFSEIIDIVDASKRPNILSSIATIGIPLLFLLLSRIVIVKNEKLCLIITAIWILCSLCIKSLSMTHFKTKRDYTIAENKIVYFIKNLKNITNNDEIEDFDYAQTRTVFQSYFPENEFIDEKYPFLHKDNSHNVLKSYFNLSTKRPNIVIVIVEGLGREFSGENSLIPSATPFLDSLAKTGLSWNNCFSTSQRTNCALPSILGALPYGESGFMNYKESAPQFHSLYTILNDNGYASSFFYGGWLCFDDMCHFLKINNVGNYIDINSFDTTTQTNTWGIYDDFLFEKSIETLDFSSKPRLDVYLTLTTHDPFIYPETERYMQKYREIIAAKGLQLVDSKIKAYASYLYLDESVRHLMNMYKAKPEFENTLFVITGDHDFNMTREPIVLNNVPLIIWSPMLTQNKQMSSMASHRDITPTLMALLKDQYNLKIPEYVAWLNSNLDTSSSFTCNTFSPIMNIGRQLNCFIYKDLFYKDGKTYKITYTKNHLTLCDTTADLSELCNTYKHLDHYVMTNNALIKNWIHDKNYQSKKIVSVTNKEEQLDFYKQQNKIVQQIFGEEAICFDNNFPMTLCKYTIQGNEDIIQFVMHSNVNLSGNTKDNQIALVTQIMRGNKKHYWSKTELKNYYTKSDEWYEFSKQFNISKKEYNLRPGDEVSFYLWNPQNRTFSISNLRLKLTSIMQND